MTLASAPPTTDVFVANGRRYRVPERPTLVVCIDGTATEYLENALARNLMPALSGALEAGGTLTEAKAQMPTLTNVNNATIVTGVSAAEHGIAGNHYLAPDGEERQLNDASALRAETIYDAAQRAGVRVLCVTAKNKLRGLLGAGGVPSISAEKAHEQSLPQLGGRTAVDVLGSANPDIYDPALSAYAMDMALGLGAELDAQLVYCSLTDYVQHKAAPGEPMADEFYSAIDARLGRALDGGWTVGLVADHGMNAKTLADGSPDVRYLSDALRDAGVRSGRVVLPITDPYVVHHGALGSLAWIYADDAEVAMAAAAVSKLAGVEAVLSRAAAAQVFELPPDRIGVLTVCADAHTVLGKSELEHDLEAVGTTLRSHGGLHEQLVPFVVCQPVASGALRRRNLRNADIHDAVLNHVVAS